MNNDVTHSQLSESEIADIIKRLPPESPRVKVNRTGYVATRNGKVSGNVSRESRKALYSILLEGRCVYTNLTMEQEESALLRLTDMFINVAIKRAEGNDD